MSRVIQYHASVIGADAIGGSIMKLHESLKAIGVESYVLCDDAQTHVSIGGVIPVSGLLNASLMASVSADDVLLVHFSFYDANVEKLAQLPMRKVMVYHNVTPGDYFRNEGIEWLGNLCDAARGQLGKLAPLFHHAVGDSDFNCVELRGAGFANVSTIPVFVNTDAFAADDIDPQLYFDTRRGADTNIVFIGRFVPNKAHGKLIETLASYRSAFRSTVNLHLVGKVWDEAYFAKLVTKASQLGVASLLRFHIHAEPRRLRTLLASADAFLSMSEHEGFMVPVIEAFAAGCPVIALDRGAVGETMGGAGILMSDADPRTAAGLIEVLKTDTELRARVVRGQSRRALDFHDSRTRRRWMTEINALRSKSA